MRVGGANLESLSSLALDLVTILFVFSLGFGCIGLNSSDSSGVFLLDRFFSQQLRSTEKTTRATTATAMITQNHTWNSQVPYTFN